MGDYCRICGRSRPNGQFSGRGHRIHVCKKCQRLPRGKRDRIERFDELHGLLHQSAISASHKDCGSHGPSKKAAFPETEFEAP